MEKGIQDSSAFLSHPRYFVVNGSHNGDKNIFDYSVVHISIYTPVKSYVVKWPQEK